jgi:aminoglycoside phosphotransferase (APT) family kinase protein
MTEPTLEQLIDLPALERFVNEHVPGTPGTVTAVKHTAGFSNETFFVTRGDERWVMRRPPRGPLLPSAHDVTREFRFISGLYGKARVPRPVVLCEDPSVIGAPFYLMERKDGIVIRGEMPPEYNTPAGRQRVGEEMVDALAEIHAVDWRAAGIEGRADGYIPRQLKRWSGQWELTRPRTRNLPGLDAITRWLQDHVPAEVPATIVHGDYKIDNVMFAGPEQNLIAVFDWEMATVGDPLADLGWMIDQFTVEDSPPGFEDRAPLHNPMYHESGWLTPAELAARYEQRSGRSMKDLLFYRVLAGYKMPVILEGLYMHYLEGSAANAGAAEFEWRVPMLIASALHLIETGGTQG